MFNTENMYWETYADQSDSDGFTLIGVGNDVEELRDIEAQVKEFQRKYGARCEIKLYKENHLCKMGI